MTTPTPTQSNAADLLTVAAFAVDEVEEALQRLHREGVLSNGAFVDAVFKVGSIRSWLGVQVVEVAS